MPLHLVSYITRLDVIRAKVQSQGGIAGSIYKVELAPRLFWDWLLLGLSWLDRAVKYSEGGSSGAPTKGGGSLQLFGKLPPQVGRGILIL